MEEDWQDRCDSLKESNLYLLRTGHRSDCRFLVGIEADDRIIFDAHSFVLLAASAVFERMFYGSIPVDKKEAIIIEDIEAEDFKLLLEFIYTREISINSVVTAQRLYYAAGKYMLNQLKNRCIKTFLQNITSENACEFYEFALNFDEAGLKEQCLWVIINKTTQVLHSDSFYQASIETLDVILSQDVLRILSEMDLFNALNDYAIHRYRDDKIKTENQVSSTKNESDIESNVQPSNPEEIKDQKSNEILQIKELVKKIRFLTVSPVEFAVGPAISNLLSKEDALSILIQLVAPYNKVTSLPPGYSNSRTNRSMSKRTWIT